MTDTPTPAAPVPDEAKAALDAATRLAVMLEKGYPCQPDQVCRVRSSGCHCTRSAKIIRDLLAEAAALRQQASAARREALEAATMAVDARINPSSYPDRDTWAGGIADALDAIAALAQEDPGHGD